MFQRKHLALCIVKCTNIISSMNPESENPLPTPETGTSLTEIPQPPPEGFYNPEKERPVVPRTEAARTLTKLVEILAPGSVNLEGIDSKHQVDVVTNEFQETLVPTDVRFRDELTASITPLLARLEEVGFGDYRANPYLKSIENFTITEDDKILFNSLYQPWQYGPKGSVIPSVDINKLRMAVAKLPDWPEAEQAVKIQAEHYINELELAIQSEKLEPAETLADRLDEPNLEQLETIRDTLDLISDELIDQVAAIDTAEAAKNSANRDLLRKLSAPIVVLMKSLHKNTKIGADFDKSRYPEFWQLVDRYHEINCAVGTYNVSANTARHNMSYPTL